jgi:hypothetical protein
MYQAHPSVSDAVTAITMDKTASLRMAMPTTVAGPVSDVVDLFEAFEAAQKRAV